MLLSKHKVLLLLLIIVTSVFIISILMPLEKYEQCPLDNAGFGVKKFLKSDSCYKETGPSCIDVVRNIHGTLRFGDVTEDDAISALSVMNNNTYTNVNDRGEQYSINQCVIGDNELKNLLIQDCKLSNIQLQRGNPVDNDVEWDYEDGCVVTENQLKNNISNIIRTMNDVYLKPKRESQQIFERLNDDNRRKTESNWREYQGNVNMRAQEMKKKQDALDSISIANTKTLIEKSIENSNNKIISTSTMNINKKQGLLNFLKDKVYGLRYEVYHGYFMEDLSHFTRYIPYETGFANYINNFEGMRGYPNGQLTYRISINITGCIKPDVSGTWEFALISDDASFMWITPLDKPYNSLNTSMSSNNEMMFIDNRGWHGDVRREGRMVMDVNKAGYNLRIVQGNDGGPGSLRVEMKRPGGGWELMSGNNLLFSPTRQGLTCKVSKGYYADDARKLDGLQPMCAIVLDEAYHLNKEYWNPNFGITGKAKYDNFQRIYYTDFDKNTNTGENKKTHPWTVANYPFEHEWQRNMNIYGWFIPPMEGLYTFYLASDDAAYLWFNNDAQTGNWNTANAFIKNGGVHGTIMKKNDYFVSKNFVKVPIPVRLIQGDWGGGNTLVFAYRKPNSADVTYDLTQDFRC